MTAWSPVWRLKIEGVEYTDVTLAGMTITSGRTNIYEQPQAGYANIEIINTDGSTIIAEINDGLTVEVQDSTASFVPIFGGNITDINVTISEIGSTGYTQKIGITAVGALARLNRALTDGVLVKDFDGDQIYALLNDLLLNNWTEVPAALTWATYDPTVQWQNAENSGLGEIDQPGDYELHARSASVSDYYSIAQQIANSALGYVYEDAQGRIGYADSTHRGEYLLNNGYTVLDGADAIGRGISTKTRWGDIRNAVIVGYKNNSSETAEDISSIETYGRLEQKFATTLEHQADAAAQAQFYLDLRAYPRAYFDRLNFELTNANLSNAQRDALIGIFMGLPIRVTDIPTNMGSVFEGYVEGWTWSSRYNAVGLTITSTPIDFSTVASKWMSVSVAEAWNTVSNTLTWQDAFVVA
jgi:hypothetical protein